MSSTVRVIFICAFLAFGAATACTSTAASTPDTLGRATSSVTPGVSPGPSTSTPPGTAAALLPTGPQVPSTTASTSPAGRVYAHTGVAALSPAVATAKQYVYVPSNDDGSVTVIDQATTQVVGHFPAGRLVQHVVADWDLRTLYATASNSNRLVAIDPSTGAPTGVSIPVDAPYNLYFTPDGSRAVVMAERRNRIDFYDRTTWKKISSTPMGACRGVNHADWSVDETWFLATCEFSGDLIKVDTATGTILNRLALPKGSMPQDVRLAPDGSKFYVADMQHGGVWIIDAAGTAVLGSITTGTGAHGIYPSRDATRVYVTNRGRLMNDTRRGSHDGEGSVSVIDPTSDTVVETWTIPGGGSPDMGGVSADGTRLWLSGRYDSEVYVFDTTTGQLAERIKVPSGPHGLNVFPQPGRYSLGHTGNYR